MPLGRICSLALCAYMCKYVCVRLWLPCVADACCCLVLSVVMLVVCVALLCVVLVCVGWLTARAIVIYLLFA